MSLTPVQRQALAWAARPPGPQAFWSAVGSSVRALGQRLDAIGKTLEAEACHEEKRTPRNFRGRPSIL